MPSNTKSFAHPLLYIDDNPQDRALIREAIRATNVPFDFHGVDGLQGAVDYFLQSAIEHHPSHLAGHRDHPRPALVLLDYDLGHRCGTDFLYWLRTLHCNTAIPVVMYSGSAGHDHVGECYARGADHFLRKAQSFLRTKAVVLALHSCFFLPSVSFQFLARLPESEPDPRGAELVPA